jgi:hypothetical protein
MALDGIEVNQKTIGLSTQPVCLRQGIVQVYKNISGLCNGHSIFLLFS